ncbi:MAG TPA: hypothetical protein ENJ75_02825 [Candidatus Kaiserbacteria bacterium]|nr:hypothetical protein [Candidatus Kaiserbacteria bacterium]
MSAKTKQPHFPIVDSLLLTPKNADKGYIGICTNTSAPGQVYNDIRESLRESVSVLGPLIVNRDGTERMILNTLVHPTMTYLILFSEESLTFSPSTNLLLALKNGFDKKRSSNYIAGGKAMSAYYPNISPAILDTFRKNITVIPLFMSQNKDSSDIIEKYIEWLEDSSRLPKNILEFLKEANTKKKKYFDQLNELVAMLDELPKSPKATIALDPKDFQQLQPPRVDIKKNDTPLPAPFRASIEDGHLRLDIRINNHTYFIRGDDDFRIEYTLMRFLGKDKSALSPIEQFLIGAELNRINVELSLSTRTPSFVLENNISGTEEIFLEPTLSLMPDKEYYYKIGLSDDELSVMCMAFDTCAEVFDLRSKGITGIFTWLSEKNRFQNYEMDILHRMDIGGQIGRARIALRLGYSFIQDFPNIFKINTKELPLVIAESDSFLDTHRNLLMKVYTEGITEAHGDERKGLARTAIALAVYRDTKNAFSKMPAIYAQGDLSPEAMRESYKKQLLRFDYDGDYSYGERTRAHFGFDQLKKTQELLKDNPSQATIVQRFDPIIDMGISKNPDTGQMEYTHDPCLTHDIFFIEHGKLHSFHIARAHNLPNAYPENVFGLYDAYVSTIRDTLKLKHGDMYMLSSRGNILLLTEEQRVRKIIAEPSKPMSGVNRESGPALIGKNVLPAKHSGVSYLTASLTDEKLFNHSFIERIRNFEGVDTLERAIKYLKTKGASHNNPILTTHQAGITNPQDDHLAFFQANVFGKKIQVTAIFSNHKPNPQIDIRIVSALAGQYASELSTPLGETTIFYINGES